MRSRRLLAFTFLAIATLALVAVACGGGKGEKATATSTRPAAAATPTRPAASPTAQKAASPTVGAKASPTAGATAAPTSTPAPQATTAPATQTVEISAVPSLKFDKDTITVKAGSQVTLKFTNNDTGMPHNWAGYTDSTASTPIPGAKTKTCTGPCEDEITFTAPDQPGDYFFRCDVHPAAMTGTLVVQ
jgi:plastocyanin